MGNADASVKSSSQCTDSAAICVLSISVCGRQSGNFIDLGNLMHAWPSKCLHHRRSAPEGDAHARERLHTMTGSVPTM